ncbi:MAG: response regulator transcription factor [Sphingomonadales bacterium]|nr:response regulator transcription factor [Sphingomonadales bacterium]
MKKTKLFLVDDHKMMIDMWSALLNADANFEIVGSAMDAESAFELIKEVLPQVVIMDITLPGMSGIELTKLVKEKFPTIKVLGVSMHTNILLIKQMLINGASGYVSKTSSFEEMSQAILAVQNGQRFICKDVKDYITNQVISEEDGDPAFKINQLTKRELEIVNMIKEGHSSKEIAEKLFISKRTVEVHRYNIFRKLDVNNITSLIKVTNKNIYS